MKKYSVLVTGGAGYVGSHVAHLLFQQGYRVTILDNLVHGQNPPEVGARFVYGDVADRNLLDEIFFHDRIDVVIHLAAFIEISESVCNPQKFYSNNVAGLLSLLDVCLKHKIKKIIFSSSCSVYGVPTGPFVEEHPRNPVSPYGRAKLAAEHILQDYALAYGMDSIVLRFFNVAGADSAAGLGEFHNPETHLIPLLIRSMFEYRSIRVFGNDYSTEDGTCVRDYVHVKDIAQAHVLALVRLAGRHGYETFNLGTGTGFSVRQVITTLEDIVGIRANVIECPRRDGDVSRLVAVSDKAHHVLGWSPTHSSLRIILQDAVAWERKLRRRQLIFVASRHNLRK